MRSASCKPQTTVQHPRTNAQAASFVQGLCILTWPTGQWRLRVRRAARGRPSSAMAVLQRRRAELQTRIASVNGHLVRRGRNRGRAVPVTRPIQALTRRRPIPSRVLGWRRRWARRADVHAAIHWKGGAQAADGAQSVASNRDDLCGRREPPRGTPRPCPSPVRPPNAAAVVLAVSTCQRAGAGTSAHAACAPPGALGSHRRDRYVERPTLADEVLARGPKPFVGRPSAAAGVGVCGPQPTRMTLF